MIQTTLLGELTVDMGTSDNLLLKSRLTPTVSMDVEQVYAHTSETVASIKELLPHITHELITTEERMNEYLQTVLKNGIFAIDTEVDGLNPRLDKIAGISIWTPNENPVYIPINHHFYDYNLDARKFVRKLAKATKDGKAKALMHNSKYDMRVLYNYSNEWMDCYFDTLVAGHMLDENSEHGLKYLWNRFCMGGKYGAHTYGDLFERRKYSSFDPTRVYVYATLDVVMTYQLFLFQLELLTVGSAKNKQFGLQSVAKLFWDMEMPVVHIATYMEERGIGLDLELNSQLSRKYEAEIREEMKKLQPIVDKIVKENYHKLTADQISKLDTPVNISSDRQAVIILYYALGFELSPELTRKGHSKRKKRKNYDPNAPIHSTDKEAIKYFIKAYPEHTDLLEGLVKVTALKTIYNTFLIGIREKYDNTSGRVHGGWNPHGTKTGRFSSSSPNL